MGDVVQLRDYLKQDSALEPESAADSLVPVEFAAGFVDRSRCLSKAAEHGIQSIHIRRVTGEADALLYLVAIKDAIELNKRILEKEAIGDEEIVRRIDLIQMLENMNPVIMESFWDSFTQNGNP